MTQRVRYQFVEMIARVLIFPVDVEQTAKITADLRGVDYSKFDKKLIDGVVQYQVFITLEVVLGHKHGTVGFQLKVDDQLVGQISLDLEERG